MKILKLYQHEEDKNIDYGSDSPLLKEIKKKYGCDEVVLGDNKTEAEIADIIRDYDVLLTMWRSPHIPNELAQNPGKLRWICNITGEISRWIDIDIVESPHITVTNWGNAPAYGIAEGAFALLMAVIKEIPLHIKTTKDRTDADCTKQQASLYKKHIGIYGMGAIGSKFVEFLRPFEPIVYTYDPYAASIPEGVTRVESLEKLFDVSQIIVIHAGLTPQTRGSVKKEHLARIPDGGIVINTARGQIIDYDAIKAEIMSGRLRAGLDVVTDKNMPEENDPIRDCDNVIFTNHHVGTGKWGIDPQTLDFASQNCLENLERFSEGKELKFVMTPSRYKLST